MQEIYPVADLATPSFPLAVDLEGVHLSREGSVCILQILRVGSNRVWLIDVTTLGAKAFEEKDHRGISLREVLESPKTQKLFFDVRNDSDALYNLHGVLLQNVYDLQVLELAVRLSNGTQARYVTGLRRAMETYLDPPASWKKTKDEGKAIFDPAQGGSYEVFEKRPLDPRIVEYCAQDVTLLSHLRNAMRSRMGGVGSLWEERILKESRKRVEQAKLDDYAPNGPKKILAPKRW
ncbi:hypothetical protein BDN72DRAFT_761787 [Pluteus cervinus]|uniref:Uncharacterized protein n=1 Tax=Pluteus cervinus TaxID=181527 RepID=A0ACD3B655_9AGAR|nr:hypothetical protein BDN72DRAFT_761787 [Pluteus cervinus]